jgi:hypothetical protein
VRQTFFQLMEFQSGAWPGAAPTGVATCDRSALPPESVGRGSLVREDPREVGSLSGGVMSPGGSTPVRPVNGRHSLSPPSFTRRPVGSSRESPSLVGRTTGLPRSADVPRWVGSPLFAGGATSAPGELGAPGPDHMPFWPERISILRSFFVTTFIAASHELTHPSDPGPRPLRCWQSRRGLALSPPPEGEDTLSRGLGTPPLPEAHSPVGYCWQNSRCCRPLRGRSTATSTTSCRTLTPKFSGRPKAGPLQRMVRPLPASAGAPRPTAGPGPCTAGRRPRTQPPAPPPLTPRAAA